MTKTLIITSCTGKKYYSPDDKLIRADFEDKKLLRDRIGQLAQYRLPASEMYTGEQHVHLMNGIYDIRSHLGHDSIDLYIVSAGFGLISEQEQIVPYNMSFSTLSRQDILMWSDYLEIHKSVDSLIQGYEMTIFLLGNNYIRAVMPPFESQVINHKMIFLTSKHGMELIPNDQRYYSIEICNSDAARLGHSLISLKGFVFWLIAQEICTDKISFSDIYDNPYLIYDIMNKYEHNKQR